LGQWQESGRDQGHCLMGIGVMGVICEMAWSQGVDLYGHDDNRFLRGAEYVARYNTGNSVPYAAYDNCDQVNQTVISPEGRGEARPIWEMVYHHYAGRRGLAAPNCAAAASGGSSEEAAPGIGLELADMDAQARLEAIEDLPVAAFRIQVPRGAEVRLEPIALIEIGDGVAEEEAFGPPRHGGGHAGDPGFQIHLAQIAIIPGECKRGPHFKQSLTLR
jgi:hypothetical protein